MRRRITLSSLLVVATLLVACTIALAGRVRSTHPIFASRPTQYKSKFLKAIEPLQAFHITHSNEAVPLNGFHPDAPPIPKPEPVIVPDPVEMVQSNDTDTNLDTEPLEAFIAEEPAEFDEIDLDHWSVNGAPHSYHKGQAQLYPDKIQLQFMAFGERIMLELHIIRDLFNEHSVATLMEGDQVVSTHRHVLQSYWATLADGSGWATATLHRDGKFQAIVHRDGETIQVDPVEIHSQDMEEEDYQKLHRAAHHHSIGHPNCRKGMVVHRHSDFVDLTDSHKCGAVRVGSEKSANFSDMIEEEPLMPFSASSRRLMQAAAITAGYGNFPSTTSGITKWTNCWFGDSTPQRLSVGFAVDTGMYEIWGSVAGVQQYLAWQLSVINLIYLTQLNMFLTLSDVIIESVISPTASSWNDKPPSKGAKCPITINSKLTTLSTWRGAKMTTTNSIWSLQTNCYPPSGTVGLAWIGVLCNTYYGASISTYMSNQWLTTAHEIGHNFGAAHTFQNGQGSTGGIMDYGDGRLNGIFQFNTAYSKPDMCATMSNTAYTKGITPYCTSAYTPVCGNGVLEPGEACDDKTSCCGQPGSTTPCQLTAQAQCSGETPCCTGCKFKPSSTVCLNGNGYCRNGFCASSPCQGYSGLSYCGPVPTNPCRQQCSSAGVCSSSYTSPDLNVPDGVVCNTSPYSTCSGGQCVQSGTSSAPTVTYTWSTSTWSACTCEGNQNRAAYCTGSDGSIGTAGTQCSIDSRPSLSQTCTPPSSCVTYSWKVSDFSSCSVDCGGGISSATVQCIASNTGLAVADSSCTTTKPASTQSCNSNACVTVFSYTAWSACSVGCGGGVSTRVATCQQTQNGVTKAVSSSYCTGLQATSQACNTQACQAPQPTVTYSLTYGTWGTCSASCGTGSQSRPAYCIGSDGVTYDNSKCNCGPSTSNYYCPLSVQSCNTQMCPVYMWNNPGWSDCSLKCGGGIRTRNVQCMNIIDATPVPTTNCIQAKPVGVESCNTQTCSTYKWGTGLWQPCSKSCGGGTQTRAVSCINDLNVVVSASSCTGTAPASSQSCNVQTCPVYQWLVGPWSTCSAWCGGGTQSRTVRCVAIGSLTSVAFSNCDTSNIPAGAQYCNTGVQCPLNSDTQWVLSSWSDCSQICGGDGIRNRTVVCTNSTTGLEVDPKFCPVDYVPEVSSTCADVSCPTYWYTTEWSECSSQCAGGSQTREVECRYVTGDAKIDDELCTGTKPSTSSDCNLFPCPKWIAQSWGDCSTRCNDGVQTRQVDCVTWDNQNTTLDQCASVPIPITSQICRNQPCPHWHRGPWSYCDAPCGGGNQTRELVCRMPHDEVWHGQIVADETLCPAIGAGDSGDGVGETDVAFGKPASWQRCNNLPCPNYYWDVVKYSECTKRCGSGTQDGTVVCKSAADQSVVENNLCLGEPPLASRACNTDPCPSYSWMATDSWSDCSVVCDTGTQTRTVHCVNTNPAEWKHVQFEITNDESLCSGQSKIPSIQPCSFPKSVCWGNGGMANMDANGLCQSDGTCLCRAGWAGVHCEETPQILNVLTNGASFTDAGIPFGDTLTVHWSSQGSIPYVSVLLLRNHASNASLNWPVPSYIAKDIINTGSFSWPVGEQLKDLESGDGFTVRIWFSNKIWAENKTPFTIADPCAYKSCGIHGTCGIGGICECVTGYSGASCSLGPCERAMCSTSYGSCSNDDYIGLATTTSETVGICLCGANEQGHFDGYQCRTPPGCEPKCKNGADLFNVIIDLNGKTSAEKNQCGICGCTNMWGGDDCGTCGLSCQNGGIHNANCTSCDCTTAPGYFGSTCGCKYYSMQLRLDLLSTFVNPSEWIQDPISNARFARTLAIDLALASGQSSGINVQVNVLKLTLDTDQHSNSVLADIQFGLECPTLAEEMVGGIAMVDTEQAKYLRGIQSKAQAVDGQAFNNLLSPYTIKNSHYSAFFPTKAALEASATLSDTPAGSASGSAGPSTSAVPPSVIITEGRPSLLSVYNIVANMFEDLSSPVYRGVITSSVALAEVISVTDLTGQDSPRTPAEAKDPFKVQQQGVDTGIVGEQSSSSSLSKGAIAGIVVAIVVVCACMCAAGAYLFKISGHKAIYEKPRLAGQHQSVEGGTQLASSQAGTPADTPHHTPPQPRRTISDLPQRTVSEGKYVATPSHPVDEDDSKAEVSTQHVNFA